MEDRKLDLVIVDLAGSERSENADNIEETSFINTSLLALGKCFKAFRAGQKPPIRDSKLTKCLGECFNPAWYKIYIIAHINRSGMYH